MTFYLPEVIREGFKVPTFSFSIPFAVPAVLYCVNNNIAVHMQLHMDPTTYQVYYMLLGFTFHLLWERCNLVQCNAIFNFFAEKLSLKIEFYFGCLQWCMKASAPIQIE